jgi:hypothetical protein
MIERLFMGRYKDALETSGFSDVRFMGSYDATYHGYFYTITARGPDNRIHGTQFTFGDEFFEWSKDYPEDSKRMVNDHLAEVASALVESLHGRSGIIPVAKDIMVIGDGVWVQQILR